jgi:hypothetical protein
MLPDDRERGTAMDTTGILFTDTEREWLAPMLRRDLLFSDAEFEILTPLLRKRPVAARKLMVLRLIDKIDACMHEDGIRIDPVWGEPTE